MKKIMLLLLVILLIVGLTGCIQLPSSNDDNEQNVDKKNISVTTGNPYFGNGGSLDYLLIDVTLSGDKSTYHLILSDQDGNTVSENYVTKTSLVDGIATVSILLGDCFYRTGSERTFTLIILDDPGLDGSGYEVYRTTLSYMGADVSIKKCSSPIYSDYAEWSNSYKCSITVTIENTGDLPAYINDIGLSINKKKDKTSTYALDSSLKIGEQKSYTAEFRINKVPTTKNITHILYIEDVCEKKIDYKGARVSLENYDDNTYCCKYLSTLDKYYLTGSISITIKNLGDLPAFIDKVDINADGEEGISSIHSFIQIDEIETFDLELGSCGYGPGPFDPGTISVTYIIWDQAEIIDTISITTEVG